MIWSFLGGILTGIGRWFSTLATGFYAGWREKEKLDLQEDLHEAEQDAKAWKNRARSDDEFRQRLRDAAQKMRDKKS